MFDKQKVKDLQQRSHNRGLLSKEFYHNEQAEMERKRREMKQQLDRQVEERRRQKQQQKMERERKMQKEEEEIKNYYKRLDAREKKISGNESNMKYSNQPYQTYPIESIGQSRTKGALQQRNRGSSKPSITFEGDIPLLPVMPPVNTDPSSFQLNQALSSQSKNNLYGANSRAIPLLDLSEEPSGPLAAKTKKTKKSKREKTLEGSKDSHVQKMKMSRPAEKVTHDRFGSNNDRRSTLPDQESIVGSLVRANNNSLQKRVNEGGSSLKDIEEVQVQNNSLKIELKKNQEAVSLLMGAMLSNGKLDKYRAQAERILKGNNNLQGSVVSKKQEKKEEDLMLPRINLKHQSIMHDYLLSAAKRGKKSLGK